MNKKIITLAALSAGAASFASADMIAGWDFSNLQNVGGFFVSTDGASLTGDVDANYAGGAADFVGAQSLGSVLFDGTAGSTALSLGTQTDVGRSTADSAVANRGYLGTLGSRNVLVSQGQAAPANIFGLGFASGAEGDSFVVAIDLGAGFTGSQWGFTFAGFTVSDADGSSISWEYSTDGALYTPAGITSSLTAIEAEQTVDLSGVAALDNAQTVFFRGTLSGINQGSTVIDNLAVDAGVVVPEPSTYAAIAGVLALAAVAYRRRK